ncbi:MAG: ABC transporter ATP-binding protein [Rikenellaceae bacterium]
MESVLTLERLCLGYNKIIYSEINAAANKNEIIALVGPNGVGKSTLLKSIAGILKYHSGSIKILNRDLRSYSPNRLAEQLSFVPSQSPRAKNFSLFDMVSTSCYNRTNWLGKISGRDYEFIYSTLKKVGLDGFAERDSSQLSDGEFQRAAIARSLVQDSQIILLDEPTAFLDIANKITITRLLKEITEHENKTIIFSTHDLQHALKICDKIWIMGHNRFFCGDPQALIEKGAFEQMFKDSSLKFDAKLFTYI